MHGGFARVRGALDGPFRRFPARADGGEAAKAGIAVGQRIISVSGTVRVRAPPATCIAALGDIAGRGRSRNPALLVTTAPL